jgi:hypothetical protein
MKFLSKNEISRVGGGNNCLRYIKCFYVDTCISRGFDNRTLIKPGCSKYCPEILEENKLLEKEYVMLNSFTEDGKTKIVFLANVCY